MMVSYNGDPALKRDLVREIEKHRKADQIIQGAYGKENGGWKGCAIGCSLRSLAIIKGVDVTGLVEFNDHKELETIGWPLWLSLLVDGIFEGLPIDEAVKWPGCVASAIPVGADLAPVEWEFKAYLMRDNLRRVRSLKDLDGDVKIKFVAAVQGVLDLIEEAISTGRWNDTRAERAARGAWSAARSAKSAAKSAESAESAERAAKSAESAERAAWSAWSAWSAARIAARSAERGAAWSAAWSAERAAGSKYANALVKMLRAA